MMTGPVPNAVPIAGAVALGLGVTVAVAIGAAVGGSGQEADFRDAGIDAVLQQPIQAGGLSGDLGDVGDLGLEGETELMTAVTDQTDLLGVIAFEYEGHGNPWVVEDTPPATPPVRER